MLSGRLKIGCVPNVHSLLEEKKRILHIPNISHKSLEQLKNRKNNQILGGLNKIATTKKEDKVSFTYFLLPIYSLLLVMGSVLVPVPLLVLHFLSPSTLVYM